ncbi:UNVERIFIED_CONTAM: hypothetical protein HDU68_012793 [Siphonaria sp. JEL0065]|nr:hypothetical protein HDU68_012793 [Siphonaria sp. JEL0065]
MVLSPSNFAVSNLPNETASLTASLNGQYAGLLPSSTDPKNPSNYFFWYFPTVGGTAAHNNLVIWLNGGPGCSSLLGSWIENGPINFKADGSLAANPYSWHKQANVLYVEQPVGTGFDLDSITSNFNETGIASFFYTFLDNFASVFTDVKTKDLFITGESYAGTYIPHISTGLISRQNWTDGSKINFKGIGLGNPALDSKKLDDYRNTVDDFDFFKESGFFTLPHASDVETKVGALAQFCKTATPDQVFNDQDLALCNVPLALELWYVYTPESPGLHQTYGINNTCFDPYHITNQIPCDVASSSFWRQEAAVTAYLNNPDVQKAIHVSQEVTANFTWNECNGITVNRGGHFNATADVSASTLLDSIIAADVKVVIYEGMNDGVCHYVYVERVLGNTTWKGSQGFKAPFNDWSVESKLAGKIRKDRGLTYIQVNDAGHMVPSDQPASAFGVLAELLAEGKPSDAATYASASPITVGYISTPVTRLYSGGRAFGLSIAVAVLAVGSSL